jgi:chromosome partitioning protein
MPVVITVIQQKGGTGKTSLTANLGVCFARQGFRVALVDLDPQGSLGMWHKIREANGHDVSALTLQTSTPWRIASDVRNLGKDSDLVLIDNPPHVDSSARQAVKVGDLVLVPCQLSPVDIWATRAILEMILKEDRPCKVVLNRVPAVGKVADALRHELTNSTLPLTQTALGNRTAFMASFLEGLGVIEYDRNSLATQEIIALSHELLETLHLKPEIPLSQQTKIQTEMQPQQQLEEIV